MNNYSYNLFEGNLALDAQGQEPENVTLAGFHVTRGEFFATATDPALTIWKDKIKFSMGCLKRFPGVTHIQLLVNEEQKRIVVKPCTKDDSDALRWARGGSVEEIKNREMLCRIFAGKIFDMMNWNGSFRYKLLGHPAVAGEDAIFLFRLTDFEFFTTGKGGAYFPKEWMDHFGVPVEEHHKQYSIDLADGYARSGR